MVRIVLLAVAWFACVGASPVWAQAQRPNVLFIAVDDLRPQLGCYGHAEMRTPNIDRLAATGVRFTRQFVQVPTCGASRYALLTSQRPTRPIDLSNNAFDQLRRARPATDDAASDDNANRPRTVVELFRQSGYRTVGLGKISHSPDGRVYGYDKHVSDVMELPGAWDEMNLPYGPWNHGWRAFFAYADGTSRTDRLAQKRDAPPTESADGPDTGYPDGLIARAAADQLRDLKSRGGPFFLAVGFFKPHLPFTAPKRYWDLYPPDHADLSPAPDAPAAVHPKLALHPSDETARYTHPADWRTNDAHHRHLRRAYRAAVSYVDAQVGVVLEALEREGLADNTIVVLWGDHGFHLGDLTIWGKHTLFDWSLRSPLIVRVPGTTQAGRAAEGIVEALDVYPTLADLCSLAAPEKLAGRSLRPQLEEATTPGKPAAFSYWNPNAVSMRTEQYRLTRYRPRNAAEPAYELYDVQADPLETRNVAAEKLDVVTQLAKELPTP